MRALFFGTYDATAHPRVGILIHGLREHGVDVVECNVALGLSTAARVSMLKRPWLLPGLGLRLARCWITLARRARQVERVDVVVVGYLGHFDVRLARRLYPRTPIVLDHLIGASDTGADRGVRGGVRQRLLRRLDDRALRAADLVLVDTDEHREVLPAVTRLKTAVVAVGAPPAWLAAVPEPPGRPDVGGPGGRRAAAPADPLSSDADRPLRVVFFGLFTPLQGAPVIGRALDMLAADEIEATMVGSGQDLPETRRLAAANSRVRWEEWVPAHELPALVASHDVCLGIFGTGPKARRVVPNKIFQGAAAGCALVTSDTPPQRRLLDDAAIFVPSGDPSALASALRTLAADRAQLAELREAAWTLARGSFTPSAVTATLVDRLVTLTARSGSARATGARRPT